MKSHRHSDTAPTLDGPDHRDRDREAVIAAGTDTLAICDSAHHLIRIYDPATAQLMTLAGTRRECTPSVEPASLFDFKLEWPRFSLPHPFIPGALFVTGQSCVYLIDVAANQISIYAGATSPGYAEGERTKSLWAAPQGMAALNSTKEEKSFWSLYVCDRQVSSTQRFVQTLLFIDTGIV